MSQHASIISQGGATPLYVRLRLPTGTQHCGTRGGKSSSALHIVRNRQPSRVQGDGSACEPTARSGRPTNTFDRQHPSFMTSVTYTIAIQIRTSLEYKSRLFFPLVLSFRDQYTKCFKRLSSATCLQRPRVLSDKGQGFTFPVSLRLRSCLFCEGRISVLKR